MILHRRFKPGDLVIFRKPKRSTSPGPRARHITPARHGEEYAYEVPKFWVIEDVQADKLVVRTRRGKRHLLEMTDQRLRLASWWERMLYRDRFPSLNAPPSEGPATAD